VGDHDNGTANICQMSEKKPNAPAPLWIESELRLIDDHHRRLTGKGGSEREKPLLSPERDADPDL